MPDSRLAAQLFTLREYTQTPTDIAKTLARVKKLGYDAVQCSALGPIDPLELAKLLKNEGLTCCATHVGLDRLKNESARVIEEHRLWGCRYTAIGGFFKQDGKFGASDWTNFCADYNAVAKKFDGSGLSIGYHNHSHELAKFDGRTALDILFERLDRSVWMEVDTYWITHGGGDPAAWVRRAKGRIPCVHLKDMGIHPDRTQFMAEVGEGNLNWPEILKACREAGVEWYIVEQDTCYRDPFESLGISLKNLRAMGIQ